MLGYTPSTPRLSVVWLVLLSLLASTIQPATAAWSLFDLRTRSTDAVLLREISALTFSASKDSTARRGSSVPQLQCQGPKALKSHAPTTAMCRNVGWDGSNVQWACEAELPSGVKLADATVSCEGWDSPNDPYILKGSCALLYTLTGSPVQQVVVEEHPQAPKGYRPAIFDEELAEASGSWLSGWTPWILTGLVCYGIYRTCASVLSSLLRFNRFWRRDRNMHADVDPVRDYQYRNLITRFAPFSGWSSPLGEVPRQRPPSYDESVRGFTRKTARPTTQTESSNNSGAGFYSGLAAGGLGGYLFGSRRAAQTAPQQETVRVRPAVRTAQTVQTSRTERPTTNTERSVAYATTQNR